MAAIDLFTPPGGRDDLRHLAHHDWSQPASIMVAVTPHNDNDLTYVTRGLYIGGAGNVVVNDIDGNAVTFTGVLAGTILPIRVSRVKATNTTATSIVALV